MGIVIAKVFDFGIISGSKNYMWDLKDSHRE
jgi:hypothetical protein